MGSPTVFLITGIVLIIGGFLAAFNPFAATLTVEILTAWIFLFGGVGQLVALFMASSWSERIWAGLLALACIWLGVSLLFNPLQGILTLTFVAAAMFLISGIAKVFVSFSLRGTGYFWVVLISGVVSVALAIVVFGNFFEAATVLLGIMLAIELVSSGTTLVVFSRMLKNSPADT